MIVFKIVIEKYREELGISQRELALRAGLSHSYLSEIENNLAIPSLPMLEKIGNALGICFTLLILPDDCYIGCRCSKEKS